MNKWSTKLDMKSGSITRAEKGNQLHNYHGSIPKRKVLLSIKWLYFMTIINFKYCCQCLLVNDPLPLHYVTKILRKSSSTTNYTSLMTIYERLLSDMQRMCPLVLHSEFPHHCPTVCTKNELLIAILHMPSSSNILLSYS